MSVLSYSFTWYGEINVYSYVYAFIFLMLVYQCMISMSVLKAPSSTLLWELCVLEPALQFPFNFYILLLFRDFPSIFVEIFLFSNAFDWVPL